MNLPEPALLAALFVVSFLLAAQLKERTLTAIAALVMLSLAVALAFLAAQHGDLARVQGLLVLVGLVTGGAVFHWVGQESAVRAASSWSMPKPSVPKLPKAKAPAPAPKPSETNIDELNFQDYQVIEKVGTGGMGSVYKAKRRSDGRTVALKVPQQHYLSDEKFVKRFYREAEMLKRFSHPNIVRVYDYRSDPNEHYIAMEFIEGESLEDQLEMGGFSYEESVQILRALADALRHIHFHNVVHRDIKPANVMMLSNAFVNGKLREGGLKLMDFGIAVGKVVTRLTMVGARVGTPIYMAPEQAKGDTVDSRSDVYSLGLVAYEMISGQTAFKGSYEAVVHQQVFETPKPPKQIRMDIPGKLNDLILHMIEKDPNRRPTLDEVIDRIDAGILEEEVFTDPVALVASIQEKRGTLRLLDLSGKLRNSLRDAAAHTTLPGVPNSIATDEQGNIYAALLDYRQGQNGHLIRKFAPDGSDLLSFGTHGLEPGQLLQPVSIAVAGQKVYVLDGEAHQVVVYSDQGEYLFQFGGRGQGMGHFSKPRVVAVSRQGQIYVLDSGNYEVQRFNERGEYVSRYAFRKDRNSEELRELDGLTVDQAGAVYIMDNVAHKLRKIEADGSPGPSFSIESFMGEPTDYPWILQVGPVGQIFAVRQGGQMLRIYSAAGDLLTSRDLYAPLHALSVVQRSH